MRQERTPSPASSTPDEPPAGLLPFVPFASPELAEPRHLAVLADALTRAETEPLRIVVNTPPQHGKSTLVFHWLAKLLRSQARRILYITYSHDFAVSQMRLAKPIAERGGVPFSGGSKALCEWMTRLGGTFYATGIGGAITGRPGGIIVVDDPIKDWTEAQSPTIRETAYNWLRSSVLTRMHPSSSVIVVQTRWHEDDVSGRLERDGWLRVNLKAIQDNGTALWPEERPLPWLEEQRSEKGVGPFIFAALYQGEPRPKGGAVFNGVSYYDTLPSERRAAIGVDLAYTAKTAADSSISIVVETNGTDYYVTDVIKRQVAAPEFALTLKAHSSMHPGAPMRWYASGTEKGSGQFIQQLGIPLTVMPATADKYVRAQPTAAMWNAGKIHLPRNAPWVPSFLRVVLGFTGVGDTEDDEVDAMAAAFDALQAHGTGEITMGPARATTRSLLGMDGGIRSRLR